MTIKEIIALTFAYFHPGQSLADAVLLMYAEDLSDMDSAPVIRAYLLYRRDPKNTKFPLPAKIRELIRPEQFISPEDQAVEIAARICAAIPKCGWNNARSAEGFIGPVGWQVVQRQGGWSYLCENMGLTINPTSFQAQVRDQLKASLRYGDVVMESAVQALPQSARGGDLIPISGVMQRLTSGDTEAS